MDLYGLKYTSGYLKRIAANSYEIVNIDKASVYSHKEDPLLLDLIQQAKKNDLSELQLIKIRIEEETIQIL